MLSARAAGAIAAALLLAPALAHAQTPPTEQKETCVDVKVGSAQAYDCLNQELAGVARNARRFSSDTDAPYSAVTTPAHQTGQFNEAATRERLGTSFGHSVIPERPTRTYAPPLATARPR